MNNFWSKLLITAAILMFYHSGFNLNLGRKITKQSSENTLSAKELYDSLRIESLPYKVFELAYTGYSKIKEQRKLERPEIITIIDYTKSSTEKRLYVIDLLSKRLIFNELVAHGMNTGSNYARTFSNNRHSNQSSLGFFVTGEPYEGKNGYSLKLYGLEKDFNDLAYDRGVVMHGANYVSEQFIRQNGRLGRSFGCTAVSKEVNSNIIQTIKGGSCMFIYYPDKIYLSRSEFIVQKDLSEI
jgi:hypothetical protein